MADDDPPSGPSTTWKDVRWAFLAAVGVGVALYFKPLFLVERLPDEGFYMKAVAAVLAGEDSGSVSGWFYTETAARLGALISATFGEPVLLYGLRLLGLMGAALTAGLAGRVLAGARRAPLAAALIMATPPIHDSLVFGNVSVLLVGMLSAAILCRSPIARVAWLCPGFLLKPYALGLASTRPLLELALPLALACLALLDTPGRLAMDNIDSVRNASPIRAIHELGLPLPWQVWTGLVLLSGPLWRGNHARGFCIAWLALPLSWAHTGALLLYPFAVACREQLHGGHGMSRERIAKGLLLVFAALVVFRIDEFGLHDHASWISGLMGLIPAGVVVMLMAWCPAESAQPGADPD